MHKTHSMITALSPDFSELSQYINELNPGKVFFLVDENTHEHCLPTVLANLEIQIPFEIIEIAAGEEMKTIETATQLWEILSEFEASRKSLLVNIGGGVITDMGGFVASTYKRGFKFINIPTTLLAMCDASIGGKTGIDHQFLKNIVGTFALPEKIFFWPDFLKTLPFHELRSGFAEMLKHGLIADKNHWNDLISIEELTPENIAPYIKRSMEIKQEVVEKDFKEENIRKTLNFGHTIGHALESLFLQNGQPVPLGEAVAAGMLCESRLAYLQNLITENEQQEIQNNLMRFYPLLPVAQFKTEDIIRLMSNDKKNTIKDKFSFSLLNGIGNCQYDNFASTQQITEVISWYNDLK